MTLGGRICPYCKKYTSNADARCIHCNKFVGPPLLSSLIRVFASNPIWATSLLAAISVAVFFGEVLATVALERKPPDVGSLIIGFLPNEVTHRFGAIPSGDWPEWWRLICACYVHFNLLHLVANMVALMDFGRILEPGIKGPRMIVSYTVTGVIGFLVSAVWYMNQLGGLTAGASGAVFGIQGLVLGQMVAAKDPRFQAFLWRTIGYSIVFYYLLRTNNAAHMGGLFSGMVLGYIFGKEKRPWTRELYFWLAAGVCLVATIAALAVAQWSYLHVALGG